MIEVISWIKLVPSYSCLSFPNWGLIKEKLDQTTTLLHSWSLSNGYLPDKGSVDVHCGESGHNCIGRETFTTIWGNNEYTYQRSAL